MLLPREIDLWSAELDHPPVLLRQMAETLSSDEAQRAYRFHFARDRDRFIASRGILRHILASYLGCTPGEIRFTYQNSGKPQVAHPAPLNGELRFNLSHSAGAAVYAISRESEVGVDIEMICPDVAWPEVAKTFFASGEIATLYRLPTHLRTAAFYDCWTRKEAYVKARGDGLSHRLDAFEVSLAPDEAPALLSARDPGELERWRVLQLTLGKGFAGALVVEGVPGRLRYFTCNPIEPAASGNCRESRSYERARLL